MLSTLAGLTALNSLRRPQNCIDFIPGALPAGGFFDNTQWHSYKRTKPAIQMKYELPYYMGNIVGGMFLDQLDNVCTERNLKWHG